MANTNYSRVEQSPSFKQSACRIFIKCVVQLVIWIHQGFDWFVEKVFAWWYCDSKRQRIPPVNNSLLLESAVSLAEKIRKKEVRSEDIVKSYIERIKEVNPIINAVVDERFEEALKEAQAVDALVESMPENELKHDKPFLGVPFTTKDSTACKGVRHTLGILSRQNVRAVEDAEVVALLKAAGGILVGVTNVPEVNMWVESRNFLHGQTNNPYDTRRTVGGSSGGEGSILAACGSPLSIGSDIGGSIRLPAFCCGVFGHKPTTGLVSTKGLTFRTGKDGRTMVSAGPMSRYVQDLEPLLRVLVGEEKVKKELKLDTEVSLQDLQVVYSDDLGDLRCSLVRPDLLEPVMRAVNHFQDISKLPVKKIRVKDMKHAFRLWHYWISREPQDFAHELANKQGRVTFWKELSRKLLGLSDFTLAAVVRVGMSTILPLPDKDWAEEKTNNMLKEIMEHLGEKGVLIFPSSPMPAMYHYASFLRPYNFAYFGIFNVLNLPVTQVPMGLNKEGLPVGIQVVGAPFQDHLCLAVAKELQKAFGGFVPPFPV